MPLHPLAGRKAPPDVLIDPDTLRAQYYSERPDMGDPQQRVAFGTSGHRGSAARRSFNEAHVLAIAQAICEYRAKEGTTGSLFLGMDTHALSEPAQRSVLEVLAANGVDVLIAERNGVHADAGRLARDPHRQPRAHLGPRATASVITPSHNPPSDGGIKYNPPNGGPADTDVTGWIEERANELLRAANARREAHALRAPRCAPDDPPVRFHRPLRRRSRQRRRSWRPSAARSLRIGVDPLGGVEPRRTGRRSPSSSGWTSTVVNQAVDPTFRFMTLDHDGKIRMDCSSPHAMASLIALKDDYDRRVRQRRRRTIATASSRAAPG